ncbi:hypothetical protein CYLTODRAFT_459907 [Cylindrobasidium torrendii FP15055 ss-10]|uniref:Uncharacterized protein n=1 Tax=Cylindrobasidium torrendii FP15055 ss-10 TaxID=1314674 RepID=A0A0D7ASP3_9AGAR|nr:hypothetical protein CYLTODRAFT_459907 [Cylindrobasidium torrendii FP15055 ss-10]
MHHRRGGSLEEPRQIPRWRPQTADPVVIARYKGLKGMLNVSDPLRFDLLHDISSANHLCIRLLYLQLHSTFDFIGHFVPDPNNDSDTLNPNPLTVLLGTLGGEALVQPFDSFGVQSTHCLFILASMTMQRPEVYLPIIQLALGLRDPDSISSVALLQLLQSAYVTSVEHLGHNSFHARIQFNHDIFEKVQKSIWRDEQLRPIPRYPEENDDAQWAELEAIISQVPSYVHITGLE